MLSELLISHSSRGVWKSCERKFEFRKILDAITTANDASTASEAGKCLHIGMQTWMTTQDVDAAVAAMMWDYPIQFETNPMSTRSLQACYATLIAMIQHVQFGQYELAYITVDGKAVPMVEVPFLINILNFSLSDTANIPVRYRGYIDIVLYDRHNDAYVVVDIKTHRNDKVQDLSPLYNYDDQCLPYALVLQSVLNKPIRNLTVKYLSVFIDTLNPVPKIYTFEKNQESMHDWASGLLYDLNGMKTCFNLGWFPRRGGACLTYGSNLCKFYDICHLRAANDVQSAVEMLRPSTVRVDDFQPWITVDLELKAAI